MGLLSKKNVHKKAAAIPRIVEEKNLKLKAIFSQKKKNIMQMCLDNRISPVLSRNWQL